MRFNSNLPTNYKFLFSSCRRIPTCLGYIYKSIEFYLLKGFSHDFVAGYLGSDFLGSTTAQVVSDSSLQRCHGECLRAKFAIHQ